MSHAAMFMSFKCLYICFFVLDALKNDFPEGVQQCKQWILCSFCLPEQKVFDVFKGQGPV